VWKGRKAAVQSDLQGADQARKKLQQKLNRLDEAFLFERSIDIDTYDRHADTVREQMTLLKIDEHSSTLEELDVEGIPAFAERVLPRATDPVGAGLARSTTAPAVAVFAEGTRFRRKWLCWNCRNCTGFQLLTAGSGGQ
jgi:hypothetical protein